MALEAVAEERLEDAMQFFTKTFQIYNIILKDKPELMQLATNNLATFSLLTNNIEQFLSLKLHYNSDLNHELIKLFRQDVRFITEFEQQITTQIQVAIQQQITEKITSPSEDVELEVTSLGNNDEFKDC